MNIVAAPVAMKHSANLLRKRSDYMPGLLRFRSWWQEVRERMRECEECEERTRRVYCEYTTRREARS